MVQSHIDDPDIREKTLRELARRKRRADQEDGQTNAKRRKRKAITKCKWCGSTSHKTKRSKACPHNPRYVAPSAPPAETVAPAETVTTAAPVPSVSPADTAPHADAVAPDTFCPPNFSVGDNVFVLVDKKKFLTQVVKIHGANDYIKCTSWTTGRRVFTTGRI